jgi:hypothetical protein
MAAGDPGVQSLKVTLANQENVSILGLKLCVAAAED